MCGRGEVVGGIGPIDELLGHADEGLIGGRPESGHECVEAGLPVGIRVGRLRHGDHPGEKR
jgi:hypothetical protein